MNFIVALSYFDEKNILFIIIYKFIKKKLFVLNFNK